VDELEDEEQLRSPQFAIYFHHELQTMEFITLANFMAAYVNSSALKEAIGRDDNAGIVKFFRNLSFRKESESFHRLWLRLMLCSAVDNFQTYLLSRS
jgi:hypothetical protein